VKLGVDLLLTKQIDLIKGKRLGLITNASGVDGQLNLTADRLAQDKRVKLVQLYAPEHGIRGAEKAGRKLSDSRDRITGLPVQSLFGKQRAPTIASLKKIDLLIFDIQDVGSRTYTYTSTMGASMQAAARAKIPFVVLDRPNPLGGELFEGPIRARKHKSFIGWGPIPVSHGLTAGELARYYNKVLGIGCDLRVVKMEGWRRNMVWADTGLPWVPTSPGIPHALHAHLYIATGMVGGISKNVNEGVGTTMPFETIAAKFIDPVRFSAALTAAELPGIRFRPISYRPYYSRFRGQLLHGVQLMPTNNHLLRPLRTALTILVTLERLYPKQMKFREARSYARVWGNLEVMKRVKAGEDVATIEASWAADLKGFAERRASILLYP